MKIKLLFLLTVININLFAQWIKVSNQNGGISGKIHSSNSVLFLSGIVNNFSVFRSDNSGQTWSGNIANKFPHDVYYMFNHKNEIFAVTTTLGQNVWRFYTSKDDGLNWSEKSNIPAVTGNGAILFMAADGNKLFAVSNRKSFYTSLDDGATWKETIINTSVGGNMIYFAAAGNTMVSVLAGFGAVVSVDGGASWSLVNVTNPALVIMYVLNYNGSIYGFTGGNGVYKFNATAKAWESMSIGLPDAASFQIPKIFYKYGNTLYFGTVGFLDSKPLFYYSNDGGLNWSSLTTNGLTTISGTTSSTSFAVTQQNIFLYDYNNTTKEASLYRLTNNTTSINNRSEIPAAFELAQNYPNPFNPETTISYELPTSTNVTLKIYDVLGNEVATLVNEFKNAGYHNVRFKSKDYELSSGVYLYRLETENFSQSKKLLLLK